MKDIDFKTEEVVESIKNNIIKSDLGKYIIYFILSPILLGLIPLCALIFYMQNYNFFSYDFFIDGFFSQKIFFIYVLLLLFISSFLFSGSVIFFIKLLFEYKSLKRYCKEKGIKIFSLQNFKNFIDLSEDKDNLATQFLGIFIILLFILTINILFTFTTFTTEELKIYRRIYKVMFALSIIINIYWVSIFIKSIKFKFICIFLVPILSIMVMGFNKDVTAKLLSYSFAKFSVGGLKLITINNIENNKTLTAHLLFLSPNNIYLKDFSGKLIIMERTNKEIHLE